jgi:hypothetical protein
MQSRILKQRKYGAINIAPVDWSSLAPAIAAKTRRARSGQSPPDCIGDR